mgnify:CR=1 FL=1
MTKKEKRLWELENDLFDHFNGLDKKGVIQELIDNLTFTNSYTIIKKYHNNLKKKKIN